MQYFNTLPKILSTNYNGGTIVLTNLMARASMVSETLKNPLLYYTYDIQDGDTPEIIAHKYYDDSYRYWIVLFSNQILDPQWEWPLSGDNFNRYIVDKYKDSPFDVYSQPHHFEQTLTQTDLTTNITTQNTYRVDQGVFTFIPQTNTYTLPTGVVSVTRTGRAVTYYTYELELNESKRNIKLLNKDYVNEFETELKKLMS
jgi:hypothetical protein